MSIYLAWEGAEKNKMYLVHSGEAVLGPKKEMHFPSKDKVKGGGLKARVMTTAG